jgi:hypothetical protein
MFRPYLFVCTSWKKSFRKRFYMYTLSVRLPKEGFRVWKSRLYTAIVSIKGVKISTVVPWVSLDEPNELRAFFNLRVD